MGNCLASPQYMLTLSSSGNLTSTVISQESRSKSSEYQCSSSALSREEVGEHPNRQVLATPNLRQFTFRELEVATKRFNPSCLLGEGGFGKVYKGCLDNEQPPKSGSGLVVAIKKLKHENCQEWQSEVNLLGRLSHPNLVKLLGFCWENKELLLVYEFMQRGSLENHLFGGGSSLQPLPWDLRLKIAIGAARSLAFLHGRFIYHDTNAANILLDGSYNAKLSDFGITNLGRPYKSNVTPRMMGSYGAAPENVATGNLVNKLNLNQP